MLSFLSDHTLCFVFATKYVKVKVLPPGLGSEDSGIIVILRVYNLILLYDSHSSWCEIISYCGFIFSLMKAVERFSTWTKAHIFQRFC